MTKKNFIRTCHRKKTFDSLKNAHRFSDHIRRKFGTEQRPYDCPFCLKFHLTDLSEEELERALDEARGFIKDVGPEPGHLTAQALVRRDHQVRHFRHTFAG